MTDTKKQRQFFKRVEKDDLEVTEAFLAEAGVQMLDIQKLKEKPRRIDETKEFDDERGFKQYLSDFCNDDSCVFIKKTSIEVNFDYHGKENPSWNDHKAEFPLSPSSYIKPWLNIEGQTLGQEDFVKFLQLNYLIVTDPSHSDLITATKNLRVVRNIDSYSSVDNGSTAIDYKENAIVVSAKGKDGKETNASVPETITIRCPYFEGMKEVSNFTIKVFASISQNKPVFKLHFLDKDQVLFKLYADIQESYKKDFDKLKIYIG